MTDLAAAEAPATLPPVKKREIFGWAHGDVPKLDMEQRSP